jgi:hypothetical protein
MAGDAEFEQCSRIVETTDCSIFAAYTSFFVWKERRVSRELFARLFEVEEVIVEDVHRAYALHGFAIFADARVRSVGAQCTGV